MFFRSELYRIPRRRNFRRTCWYGSCQGLRYYQMATAKDCQRTPVLPRLLQLLPSLHSRLFPSCALSLCSHKERRPHTFGPHPRNLPFAPSFTPLRSLQSSPSLIPPFLSVSSPMPVTS